MSQLMERAFQEASQLPEEDQEAIAALFEQDPHHPSPRFRQLHPTRPIFSARIVLH